MKKLQQYINESADTKYMNKTQLYLLSIPFEMYKNYEQYKEDFKSLSDEDYEDLQDMQNYLNSLVDDERVRVMYSKMAPSIQRGIKTICNICIKHKEDFSKLDIYLMRNILKEIE